MDRWWRGMRWLAVPAWLALLAAFMPGIASAQNCWVSGSGNLAFNDVMVGTPTDAQTSLQMTCQAGAAPLHVRYCVFVAQGAPVAGIAPRRLSNYQGATMQYDLYADPARTQLIGPPPAGGGYPVYQGTAVVPGSWGQLSIPVAIYGRVPAGQALPASAGYQSQIQGSEIRWAMSAGSAPASCNGGVASGTAGFYLGVSGTVFNGCQIALATDLDFGTVTDLASPLAQTSNITVRCPTGTSWTLGLNDGLHAAGATRRMRNAGGQYVAYELYTNDARTSRWGNAAGQRVSGVGQGLATPLPHTVYGRVPAQASAPGNYADTVTITLTY